MSYQFAVQTADGSQYPSVAEGLFSLSNRNAKYFFGALGFEVDTLFMGMHGVIDGDELRVACEAVLAEDKPDPGLVPVKHESTDSGPRCIDSGFPEGYIQQRAEAFLCLLEKAEDNKVFWSI